MTARDDSEIIQDIEHEPEAFGELYEKYVDRIYSYVYHRVGNVHDAEDLTSRTFFRALSHISSYQDLGLPFSAWLYRIAHNLLANWHRDRGRRQLVTLEGIPLRSEGRHQNPEGFALSGDEAQQLVKAMRRLDSQRQELLVLKFTEELSNAEIAAIMGRTEGAIKSLYHRTLLALRRELTKKGFDLG
ncbi:MAG TPA: sigma-70 family RNA polymerase sigma factor [Anaerolineae bacterium]|nr:sigma-70 family RNA polymerase sigma factor [Anaerolineae bacterium]